MGKVILPGTGSSSSGSNFPPKDVSNISIVCGNGTATIKWSDPEDTVVDGTTLCKWKGTKLVYKTEGYPTSQNDGIVAVTNEVRDAYATNGYEITGLTNNTTYYFQLFPYSDKNVYNTNSVNRVEGTPQTVPPDDVSNISIKSGDGKLTIKWTDPEDKTTEEGIDVVWKGTKVVYKAGSYPTSVNDGTLAIDSQVKNAYSSTGFDITGLTNDTTYYIQLFPYSEDGSVNTNTTNRIEGTPVSLRIYGIKRSLTTSSTTWERTNDAVGLVANAKVGTTAVQNDFDDLYPWSDIITANVANDGTINAYIGDDNFKFDGSNGHVMTIFPEFWLKRWQDSSNEYIQIATAAVDGFTKYDSFMLGRYTMSGSTSAATSKSGVTPLVSQNITTFRTTANALGTGWGQLDWHYFLIQYLYLVEYADYNSQAKLGKGWTDGNNSAATASGGCDSLGMKSGRPSGTDGKTSVIYRGLEDIFGNVFQFVDGLNISSRKGYICYDQTKYAVDTTSGNYKALSYSNASASNYITKLGYDSNNQLIALPTAASGGSETTYIPDYYYQNTGNRIASVGGIWPDAGVAGLWCWSCGSDSTASYYYVGARLLKI